MKRYFISPQIKPFWVTISHVSDWQKIKSMTTHSVGEDVEEQSLQYSCVAVWNTVW